MITAKSIGLSSSTADASAYVYMPDQVMFQQFGKLDVPADNDEQLNECSFDENFDCAIDSIVDFNRI